MILLGRHVLHLHTRFRRATNGRLSRPVSPQHTRPLPLQHAATDPAIPAHAFGLLAHLPPPTRRPTPWCYLPCSERLPTTSAARHTLLYIPPHHMVGLPLVGSCLSPTHIAGWHHYCGLAPHHTRPLMSEVDDGRAGLALEQACHSLTWEGLWDALHFPSPPPHTHPHSHHLS